MTTLNQMIEIIRAENPDGIRIGSDEVGYTNLTKEQYETQINQWATARLDSQTKLAEAAAKAHERSALLAKLGITEEEAALLLGGN